MVSLHRMDKVIEVRNFSNVDVIEQVERGEGDGSECPTVRVQAGASVQDVLDYLRPYGLTLPNLASIASQQIGGFTQAGAHGTGACIPPVEEQVKRMTLVTPGRGTLSLSNDPDEHPELFEMAKCGLGALGIVAELELECKPLELLIERTSVMSRAEVVERHEQRLATNRHVRYMWIPFADAVVVVTVNAATEEDFAAERDRGKNNVVRSEYDDEKAPEHPLRDLLRTCRKERTVSTTLDGCNSGPVQDSEVTCDISQLGFAQLRDELLSLAPLDVAHVQRVNRAEVEFWRRSAGTRIAPPDEVLQFECGGQQWVSEVALPVGAPFQATRGDMKDGYHKTGVADNGDDRTCTALGSPDELGDVDARSLYNQNCATARDLQFVMELLDRLEREKVPAPAPIEHRWTASSRAAMSPAGLHGALQGWDPSTKHAWVGVVMYLPTQNEEERALIGDAFRKYASLQIETARDFSRKDTYKEDLDTRQGTLAHRQSTGSFSALAVEHWAKTEVPVETSDRARKVARIAARYPTETFARLREELDPKNILGSAHLDALLPRSSPDVPPSKDSSYLSESSRNIFTEARHKMDANATGS
jgi:L-galactono-1,4-lactone dehydrogenase